MVVRLSDALHLPLDARNQLLTKAGFAAQFMRRNWTDAEMTPIRAAVERMLSQHMPYPALALDRYWTVRALNPTASALFGKLGVSVGDNLVDLVTSPTLPALVVNWPEVAHHTAKRLSIESTMLGGVTRFDAAVAHLLKESGPSNNPAGPVIPTVLQAGQETLSMFATIAQFGTPEDVIIDDLKIEMYFPMDKETAQAFDALASSVI